MAKQTFSAHLDTDKTELSDVAWHAWCLMKISGYSPEAIIFDVLTTYVGELCPYEMQELAGFLASRNWPDIQSKNAWSHVKAKMDKYISTLDPQIIDLTKPPS
jgi:hypothetical protein